METQVAIFRGKNIRKILFRKEWWFSVVDIVEALTDIADVKQYIKKMRQRDPELNSYWGTICTPLEMMVKEREESFDQRKLFENAGKQKEIEIKI